MGQLGDQRLAGHARQSHCGPHRGRVRRPSVIPGPGRIGGGDFQIDSENRILRHGDYVYGGAQILKMDAVTSMEDTVFSLNAVWNRLGAQNRLYAVKMPGHWCDVGSPEGLELAEDLIAQNV